MTLAPPRASQRPLIETRPLRHPDSADPGVMTKRGWWLLVMNLLVPGSAQVVAGNRRLGRFGLGATLLAWFLAIVTVAVAGSDNGTVIAKNRRSAPAPSTVAAS